MFLAEGVAAITTAAASVASISDLLSVQNITSLLAFLGMIAGYMGKSGLAAKLATASATVGDHKEQIQTTAALLRTVIRGVEAAKTGMSPDAKLKLVAAIQSVSKEAGMEAILSPLVVAVTKQGASPVEVATTLAEVLGKLQAAQHVKPAQEPTT